MLRFDGETSFLRSIQRAKRTLPECPGDRTLRSERRCTIPEQKRQQYGAHSPSGMSASRFEEDSGWRKKKPTLTKKTGGTNTAQPLAVEDGIDHHCPDDDWMRSNFDRDTCVAYVPPSFRNSNLWQAWMLFERCRNWLSALLPTEIGRWASFKETHHLLLTRTLMRESNEKGRIRVCSAPNVEKQK